MSQSKTLLASKVTTTRTNDSGGNGQGSGENERVYVGRKGDSGTRRNYKAYAKFDMDWDGVGEIIRATLQWYTDDGLGGLFPLPGTDDEPKIKVRRLTQNFDGGADEGFTDDDYTSPSTTSIDAKSKTMAKQADGLTEIDLTDFVKFWRANPEKNHGIALLPEDTKTKHAWSGWSDDAAAPDRPVIVLEYEFGLTAPDVPTNLSPIGAVESIGAFQGDFTDDDTRDWLAKTEIEVYKNDGTTLVVPKIVKAATNTEKVNARFNVVPSNLNLKTDGTNYKWRARVTDNEGSVSAWTALQSFTVTNTNPDAPTGLAPDGDSFATLNGVDFSAADFTDDDDGDTLLAFQIQMAPAGFDWDTGDLEDIVWDTGKRYVPADSAAWVTQYGGAPLDTGDYIWRARQWDNHDGVSDWSTDADIAMSADFEVEPGQQDSVQIDPHAPWRLRIHEMKFNAVGGDLTGAAATNLLTTATAHGLAAGRPVRFSSLTGGTGLFKDRTYYVIASGLTTTEFRVSEDFGGTEVNFTTNVTAGQLTRVTTRGPGRLVGLIENAKSLGASIVYNSPGEAHWTLPVDHQQIGVIEPKQTHYAIEFYAGDGWRETFAGLVWDYDAVETSVVFTGIDYLALYDLVLDERYDPSKPDRSYTDGGSKYVNKSIRTVIHNQLDRASKLANSPVGFISVDLDDISASMTSLVTIWSTMQPVLSFCAGLIDSHRQGTVKRSRIQVVKTAGGGYKVRVVDDPGATRDNLRLKYGELVQGYRVIPFGNEWSTVLHSIGRTREGLKVMYKTATAPGIDPAVWGRIARAVVMDNVSGEADLTRRTKQAALHGGRLGKQIAIAVRSGVLRPLDGYDVCDAIPVSIVHGAVNTENFGSGYWVIYAVTWEAMDDGSQNVTLTLSPRDDTEAPSTDLVTDPNVQTQAEWQIGWTDPTPAKATSRYWLDQTTGQVWVRDDEGNLSILGSGTVTT